MWLYCVPEEKNADSIEEHCIVKIGQVALSAVVHIQNVCCLVVTLCERRLQNDQTPCMQSQCFGREDNRTLCVAVVDKPCDIFEYHLNHEKVESHNLYIMLLCNSMSE